MKRALFGSIAILMLATAGASAQSGLPATSRPLNDCNGGAAGSDTINRDCTTSLPKADIPSDSEERKLLENDTAPAQDGAATTSAPSSTNGSNSTTEGSSGSTIGGTTGGGATTGNPAVSGGRL